MWESGRYYIAMNGLAPKVLRLMADGEFHSGSVLAETLGVTRGTVWNAVQALGRCGLEIYRVPGRGYRLSSALTLLEREAVSAHAGASASRYAIEIADVVDSTSSMLLARAAGGARSGTVIAAEWQTGGRGRLGRPWHGGIGEGATFSLLWRFEAGAGALAGLSLAAGVALASALEGLGAAGVGLKWPNDVLWRGRKLAGMLIEMHGDALGPSAVVIGIGVNVRLAEATRARIDQPVADLEEACGHALDRNAVLGRVLDALAPVLDAFAREGFAPFKAAWERRHVHQDAEVVVRLPDGRASEGIARGVAEDGALLFECGRALHRLHSGEVSVRSRTPSAHVDGRERMRSRS